MTLRRKLGALTSAVRVDLSSRETQSSQGLLTCDGGWYEQIIGGAAIGVLHLPGVDARHAGCAVSARFTWTAAWSRYACERVGEGEVELIES